MKRVRVVVALTLESFGGYSRRRPVCQVLKHTFHPTQRNERSWRNDRFHPYVLVVTSVVSCVRYVGWNPLLRRQQFRTPPLQCAADNGSLLSRTDDPLGSQPASCNECSIRLRIVISVKTLTDINVVNVLKLL